MACFLKCMNETVITVPRHVDINGTTFYDIQIAVGPSISWTVQRRFREFVDLNDKLVSGHSISRDLLPPKKVLGNRGATFLQQRRGDVEIYLQKVLKFLQLVMCRELVEFLDFNRYDLVYLLQDMAHTFYVQGESLLVKSDSSHVFSALELFAITERLKLPCPNDDSVQRIYDFSHVLDYCSQLESVDVLPRKLVCL